MYKRQVLISAGRQEEVEQHGLENEDKQHSNLTLNDDEEVVLAGNVREADAHSPERWATGRTTSSNQ